MALILEIRDRRGTTTWHPLTALPLTLGRGLSSDVILDDPYVDARHVRIAHDDAGALTVHDLGSVNGMLANGVRTAGAVLVQAGVELTIGRTTLRFRDRDEAVPPAFVESSTGAPRAVRWALTTAGGGVVVLMTMGVIALVVWLGNAERSSGMTVLSAALTAWLGVSIWAGIWAIAIRGADRRFHMRAHVVVACVALVAMTLSVTVNEWLGFFFPDVTFFSLIQAAVVIAVLGAVVVAHLTVAGVLTRAHRVRTGVVVSVGVLLLSLLGNLVRDDKFTDTPRFPAQLKPIPASLVPTHTVDEFVRAMADARSEADKAAKR